MENRRKYYEANSIVEFGENPESLRPFGDLGIKAFNLFVEEKGNQYYDVVTGKKVFPINDLYLMTKDYQNFVDSEASFVVRVNKRNDVNALELASILSQMENDQELLLDYLYRFTQTESLMKNTFKSLKRSKVSISQAEEYITEYKNRVK